MSGPPHRPPHLWGDRAGVRAPRAADRRAAVDPGDLPPLPAADDEDASRRRRVTRRPSAEEDVVVGAAKREQSLGNVASAVTVITGDRIRRFGYRTVGEAVAGVAGAYLVDTRIVATIGIRGINILGDFNTRILVLVDGASVNEAWGSFAGVGFDSLVVDRRHRAHRGDPRPGLVGVRHERVLRHHQHRHARRHRDAARVGARRRQLDQRRRSRAPGFAGHGAPADPRHRAGR